MKPGRALPPALKKTLQLAVPIALGVLAVLLLKARRPDPIEAPLEERVTSVRVLVAQPTPVVPRMLAYGTVEPGKRWSAVAQVAQKVDGRLEYDSVDLRITNHDDLASPGPIEVPEKRGRMSS